MNTMNKDAKIYIAGHNGLVGSAILRVLQANGYTNIVIRNHFQLDLTMANKVESFFAIERPEYVFLCAAKVGGILANVNSPVDFIMDNILIQSNVIKSCFETKVKKLLFLGSSCIYPKNCNYPIKESELLSGYLETSNEYYAIAKISGIKTCQAYNAQYGTNYICAMPTNLYGINDNFNLTNSHLVPALMRKFHEAKCNNDKSATVWGSGNPMRELLFADDLADACLFLMNNYNDSEIINVGTDYDFTIKDIANIIAGVVGFEGCLMFDDTKPDGTFRKVLDCSKIHNLGWEHKTNLVDGLIATYLWYVKNYHKEG